MRIMSQRNPLRNINTAWPRPFRLIASVEWMVLFSCLYFVLFCNTTFWLGALGSRPVLALHTWVFAASVGISICATHLAILLLVANRWTVKPLLTVLILTTGFATYYMTRYQVYFDTSMVRNVFKTDVKEVRDLMTIGLLVHVLLYAGPPLLIVWLTEIKRTEIHIAFIKRIGWIFGATVVAALAVMLVFQDFSSLMRNQRALRHLITPGNYIVSSIKLATLAGRAPQGPKKPIGQDARLGARWSGSTRPLVLVVVVGETARAANWGMNGYARQTTPELNALNVVNFSDVTSCGTNTEVSLPCMFSVFGRRAYDETKILSHESLPSVLQRTGLAVRWLDNQSGCKGVCDGVPSKKFADVVAPQLCRDGQCLDEVMLTDLVDQLKAKDKSGVIFMHQIGNHGPAYYNRYPTTHRFYEPTCDTPDLGKCDRAQIINSYDNAIRYTDSFLAKAISLLSKASDHDTALIYVSDHGESLGENGIFLHGLPRAIAPREQTHVPMIMWFSDGFAGRSGLALECLKQKQAQAFSHDNLFHTVLGLMDVHTKVYERPLDISASCRAQSK